MRQHARAIRAAFQFGLFTGGFFGWLLGLVIGTLATAHFMG